MKKVFNYLFNHKFKYLFNTKKIRKSLSKNERYNVLVNVPTFDGSGQTTHPSILYFENGFSGYKYWMTHTPYKNNDYKLEIPSLAVSNDGINFEKLDGVNDPLLSPIVSDKNEYYSDSFLFYDNDSLEIWYRYCLHGKSFVNKIYRIKSSDGVNWSEPELMIDNDGIWYLSISIVKIDNVYYMYYFDKGHVCHMKSSTDLKNWNEPVNVTVEGYHSDFWHGEVKEINGKLYFLFLSDEKEIYFCESTIESKCVFKSVSKLDCNFYDKAFIYRNRGHYKGTFLVKDNLINIYVPSRVSIINKHFFKKKTVTRWSMTNSLLTFEHFDKYMRCKKDC